MRAPVTLALDAMGGDHAPLMAIEGADMARVRYPDVRYLVFGDEARVRPILDRFPRLNAAAELRHAPDVVSGDAKPSAALRAGRQS